MKKQRQNKKQRKVRPGESKKEVPESEPQLVIQEVVVFVPSVDGFLTAIVVLFYTLYPSLVNRMALTFSCVSTTKTPRPSYPAVLDF